VSWRRALLVAAGVALLAGGFGPPLVEHARGSFAAEVLSDDARALLPPFFRWEDPRLFPRDYAGDYHLALMAPLYQGLYFAGAKTVSVITLSKVLPYLLLVALAVLVGLTAWRLAGGAGALVAAALCLATDHFLNLAVGGLPRAFGAPLFAASACALVWGRPIFAAVAGILAASIYPVMAIPGGLALGVLLLAMPRRDRGQGLGWSARRRLLVLAAAAGGMILCLLPSTRSLDAYGRVLRPDDVAEYPEAGPGGRYGPGSRAPFDRLDAAVAKHWPKAIAGGGAPILAAGQALRARHAEVAEGLLLGFMILGCAVACVRQDAARRLGTLALGTAVAYVVAVRVAPYFYLPQRYVTYPVPVLAILAVPTAAAALAWRSWLRAPFVLAAGLVVLALWGGRGSPTAGQLRIADPDGFYAFVATLPPDALVAGWPRDVDSVAYLSRRQTLVALQTHQAFHAGFLDEMRRRMRALLAATYARELAPLRALRDDLGVTHLVVREEHLTTPPWYFAPFGVWVRNQFRGFRQSGRPAVVLGLTGDAVPFRRGGWIVVDLRRLPP
jgi:hypothetical protein